MPINQFEGGLIHITAKSKLVQIKGVGNHLDFMRWHILSLQFFKYFRINERKYNRKKEDILIIILVYSMYILGSLIIKCFIVLDISEKFHMWGVIQNNFQYYFFHSQELSSTLSQI